MSRFDPETHEIRSTLALPAPVDHRSLSRRRFLQASGVMAGAAMLPMWMVDEAAAIAPIGATDGVLVLVTLDGGCDPLTLAAPISSGAYHDARGGLALSAGNSLSLTADRGLHPSLTTVKTMWDSGQVAVIEGVGDLNGNLSHFESMARIETAKANDGAATSGWLGRYIDGLPGGSDPFHGVSFGYRLPLVVQGENRRATVVPRSPNGLIVRSEVDAVTGRQLDALAAFGSASTGLGSLADSLAQSGSQAIELAGHLAPRYQPELPSDEFAAEMTLAARLINANLGIRVIAVSFGDFDGHANHAQLHNEGLARLNDGLTRFFDTLSTQFADQTLVLTTTEFGRRVRANNSGGTDHGAASTCLAIGSQVNAGFYGQLPSLTNLDDRGNLIPSLDYRAVYGTVLNSWLDGDPAQVIGANYEDLGFVSAPATKAVPPPPSVAAGLETRNQVFRLYRAYFRRNPDTMGIEYWVGQRVAGVPIDHVSNAFAASEEFRVTYGSLGNAAFVDLVYQNVLGRPGDAQGRAYWIGQLDSGLSRGRLMLGFSDSPEFRGAVKSVIDEWDRKGPVARLYHAYFLRAPDTEGLQFWTSTGRSIASISQAFAESPEFGSTYGTLSNQAFVDLVYRNVMDRPPDSTGLQFWTGRLNGGASRGSVMTGFSESPEFVLRFATL